MIEESEDTRERRAIEETEEREQVKAENVGNAFRDGIHSATFLNMFFLIEICFSLQADICLAFKNI